MPVRPAVASACELLGLDPLYVANEGKMIVIVPARKAEAALKTLQGNELGREAEIIGKVATGSFRVLLKTALGAHRILDRHVGEQLPRIC